MRRVLLGVALGALLTILVAAPAGAVPPNEILIAKNLQRLGVVPSYATPAMARGAARALGGDGDRSTRSSRPSGTRGAEQGARPLPLAPRVVTGKAREHLHHQHPGAARRVRRRRLARRRLHRPLPWPARCTASIAPPGAGRQRHLLAGRLQPHALPADALRQLVPDLRRTASARADRDQPPANACRTTQLRGTSDDTMRNYYLEQSHGTYTVQGDIKDWVTLDLPGVLVRRRQRPVELHRRPHRPRLARRPRRHRQVRRRQPGLRLGAVRPGEPVGHHRRRTSTSPTATSTT